jgi:Cu-Zn family superoxide dismutase
LTFLRDRRIDAEAGIERRLPDECYPGRADFYFVAVVVVWSMKTNRLLRAAICLLAAGSLALITATTSAGEPTKAIAVLHPTKGSNVEGIVTFTKSGDEIKIVADITGLTPGMHGFHIHEFGDCSSPDGKSAGGHFNPTNNPHAGHDVAQRHEGDMGNLEADSAGKAHLELTDKMMTMSGERSIIGRGVIVHEKADDLKSQPVGNAGARGACGVIGIAQP